MQWPSLSAQIDLAERLFGERGPQLMASWLAEQMARIDDPDFARQFSDHIDLPGVAPNDYSHRLVQSARGALVGGIRFYGRNIERPFIEIICHTFDNLDDLCASVRAEWAMFAPPLLRLYTRPGAVTGPNVLLDTSIYAARHRDLHRTDDRVSLVAFDDPEEALELVRRRYQQLAAEQPELARNLSPADPDDLLRWHHLGQLKAIRTADATVGLLAVAPGRIAWIDGDEINEEVIDTDHRGHGYAVAAQGSWARQVADDPDRLLIGTIDRLNTASRKTAERAGRRRVLDGVFVSL